MSFGGGGFGGGGGGGGFGGGGGGGNAQRVAMANGLPFAGIPDELADGVQKLLDREPEHRPDKDVRFSHQQPDRRHLNLRRLLAHQRGMLALAALLVVVESLSLQAGPFLTQLGIDHGVLGRNWDLLLLVGGIALFAVVVTIGASAGRIATTGRIAGTAMYDLRVRVFAHLQRLSLDYYGKEKAGVVMTRMTSDIENLQQLLQEGLVQFAVQGLTMVTVTVVLFVYNPFLATITIVIVVPVLFALSMWFRSESAKAFLAVRDGIAGVLSDLSESLSGVRVVAAFNRQRFNTVHHRNVVGHYRDTNDRTARLQGIYGPGSELIGLLGQVTVLVVGGAMVTAGDLSIGELTAFVLYLNAFFQPIQQLVQLYNTYQQGQASVTKLRELLSTEPSVPESPHARELPPVTGRVQLDGVSFAYDPDTPVLDNVDLAIEPGETICLVGPTGAGKSTIAKLVARFYDPTAGRVLLDDHDLRELSLKSLRRQLGVVPQEPFLFAGTVRDNLTFANPETSEVEIQEAIRLAGLTEMVERLPDGLETEVHERGVSLSSGERQLLAIGRAFLAKPRVLILDEATSSLDLQSETKVEAALDILLEGRTAIIVAHRLSTAMRADRIAVIDDGQIKQIGSHRELVARRGRYADMFATWSAHLENGANGANGSHSTSSQ